MEINLFENQYLLDPEVKTKELVVQLNKLTNYHYSYCHPYANIIDTYYNSFIKATTSLTLEEVPYIPVSLFKTNKLSSFIKDTDLFKTMKSSGTGGQQSHIYLDKNTALNQQKALASIITSFIGKKRVPTIIIDSKKAIESRNIFNARAAGILGMSSFSSDIIYALDDNFEFSSEKRREVQEFLLKYKQVETILVFGFTFMVWESLKKSYYMLDCPLLMDNCILIHSGGWKKLQDRSISNLDFKKFLTQIYKFKSIHNFYGMVEQVGSIYMECECGYLHAPNFSDILIREKETLEPVNELNKEGLIQTLSILPGSYPGHSILTEDLGEIIGRDRCSCGRRGTYFKVNGRVPKIEVRGCSDVY